TSPVHTFEQYIKDAKNLVDAGADSICIKDMAGLLLPYTAYDLVKVLKENVKLPIQLHSHYTAGVASMSYMKGAEAGVDVVDCALSPFSQGTSQPPTESIVASLKDTPYDTGLDVAKINDISKLFKVVREKYIKSGLFNPKVMGVDINTLIYQVPGGMLSNLVNQMKEANKEDQLQDVLNEVPKVRADFGYPPLVTPTSQIVGTQAVMNVISGERYKMVPKESRDLVAGKYGKTPVEISQEIIDKILKGEKPITHRPADDIPPALEETKNEMKEYFEQDEDVLTYAMFPKVAKDFFEYRRTLKLKLDKDLTDMEDKVHPV
ncbi:MAG: pyruvate carboxylase subunit B, partial [Clostridia bacterium]|nr:pyruvate carboxylase subunit B [Clostridia bacterium]